MSDISELFQTGKAVFFKKDDIFISPNKDTHGIYKIMDGFICIYSQSSSHKKRIQTILKKGEIFPVTWMVNTSSSHNKIFVQALTDGSALMIAKENFLTYIKQSHNAALDIVDVLLMYLRIYIDRVENLEEDTLREKLIKRILFFVGRFGVEEGKMMRIDLPITHKLIAESIGVSRENVTRELKALEREKMITFKNHQLIVLNIKKLKEVLYSSYPSLQFLI